MTRIVFALAFASLTAACGVDGAPVPAPGPAVLTLP